LSRVLVNCLLATSSGVSGMASPLESPEVDGALGTARALD
jgi:hypothetical protein